MNFLTSTHGLGLLVIGAALIYDLISGWRRAGKAQSAAEDEAITMQSSPQAAVGSGSFGIQGVEHMKAANRGSFCRFCGLPESEWDGEPRCLGRFDD